MLSLRLKRPLELSRLFCTSSFSRIREIVKEEKGKEIVIKGVEKESPREGGVMKVPKKCGHENCHPLCQLDFVHEIKHTGKLIDQGSYLLQFFQRFR